MSSLYKYARREQQVFSLIYYFKKMLVIWALLCYQKIQVRKNLYEIKLSKKKKIEKRNRFPVLSIVSYIDYCL